MFVTGTTWRKKCPVAPDSDIACDLFMWGLVFVCFYIYWCLLPLSFISYEVIGASYEDANQLPVADFHHIHYLVRFWRDYILAWRLVGTNNLELC